jgi:hypothetical protein
MSADVAKGWGKPITSSFLRGAPRCLFAQQRVRECGRAEETSDYVDVGLQGTCEGLGGLATIGGHANDSCRRDPGAEHLNLLKTKRGGGRATLRLHH